jgi:hypothetical protein
MTTATKTQTKTVTKTAVKLPSKAATKAVSKVAPKPATKSATTTLEPVAKKLPVKTVDTKIITKPVESTASVKPLKPKKIKLVRDSFTIPKPEYLILDNLKLRAADLKYPVKKGELLRAGIKALAAMTDPQLLVALKAVPMLKTGRPSK